MHYTNAKVVLAGDSGVGKSGLGMVLSGQPFVPTESTHGRRIWLFDSRTAQLDERRVELGGERAAERGLARAAKAHERNALATRRGFLAIVPH